MLRTAACCGVGARQFHHVVAEFTQRCPQFVVDGDDPILGHRGLKLASASAAVARVIRSPYNNCSLRVWMSAVAVISMGSGVEVCPKR